MLFLAAVLLFGFASAQKVIQLNYCSTDEHNLRMDCKYALPPESPEPFCKYTNGKRLFDTTDPDEEQHAPFKNRAKVRLFPGNICRLMYKNLPNGRSNFTCNIKYADSSTASKTSVVEKKLPPSLLGLECSVTELQRPAADLNDSWCAAGESLALIVVPKLLHTLKLQP
ncbi:unnamed protein product [Tetraodon nigroviridis]|uniref:(spotted green pufferfish) hypothetical protein n=1 Tax=Tetraodon nigroviridis TaxID=99883 RepID=Q4S8Z7_TETNG|nr:unnamed protein product [Tetraodon nigroviridis]